jgi:hypothetical protein
MNRKEFIKSAGLGLSPVIFPSFFDSYKRKDVPAHLKDYSDLYSVNPL